MRNILRRVWYWGSGRYCPICARSARAFRSAGIVPRPDARCPYCRSLERHRLLWRYLTERTDIFERSVRRLLHIAPEPCLQPRFRERLGEGYITADLHAAAVTFRLDVTKMPFADNSFDAAYCSHVLEHVPDDRAAMREFYRILRPGRWAILLVPVTAEATIEDPAITDPLERLRLFGQEDHVRCYGPDYEDRLKEAGFEVQRVSANDFLPRDEAACIAVDRPAAGDVYHCWKQRVS